MSTISENCGKTTNKQSSLLALKNETGNDMVEDSAALYLLSVVRSVLSYQVKKTSCIGLLYSTFAFT